MKTLARIGLASTMALAVAGCGRISENETAVIMKAGSISEVVTTPKLYCVPWCWPTTDIIRYKTFNDTFTISSGQGANTGGEQNGESVQSRQIFLRSKDDKFIDSVSLSISYEVAKTPTATKLVTEFRADAGTADENALLIRDDLQILATQPLVNTIRSYEAMSLQDSGTAIGARIKAALQAAVDARLEIKQGEQSPIIIKDVILGGVKFDAETEALLKRKVFAKDQAGIAAEAANAAAEQERAAGNQAGVTAKIVSTIQGSGAPADQISSLVCLDMLRQKLIPEGQQCQPGMKLGR